MSSRTSTKRQRTTTNNETTTDDGKFHLPSFDVVKCRPRGTIGAYLKSPNTPHHSPHYSAQFSFDVSGCEYDLLNLILYVISVFLQVDPNFLFMKMHNNAIVTGTELAPKDLKTMEQLQDYASEIKYTKYFQSSYIKFTMSLKSSELYFGGWIFNWLQGKKSLIRLSPNICLRSVPICFFSWVTLQTISFDQFYDILDTIFGRPVQKHLYSRTINLKKKNTVVKYTTGIALDVPDFEKDFATSKIFAKLPGGKSVFTQHFPNILPQPLNLSTKNSAHVDLFNDHFEWMEGTGHGIVDLTFTANTPTETDMEFINYIMGKKSDGQPLCLTSQQLGSRFIITCWLGEVSRVHETMDLFEKNDETHYLLATPPAAQTLRDYCASQSVVSDITSESDTQVVSYASKVNKSKKKQKTQVPPPTVVAKTGITEDTVKQIVQKEIQPFKNDVNNRLNNQDRLIEQFRTVSQKLGVAHKNITEYENKKKANEEKHRNLLAQQFQEVHASVDRIDGKIDTVETTMNTQLNAVKKDIGTLATNQAKLSASQKTFFSHLMAELPELPTIDLDVVDIPPLATQTASHSSSDSAGTSMEVDLSHKDSALEAEHNHND